MRHSGNTQTAVDSKSQRMPSREMLTWSEPGSERSGRSQGRKLGGSRVQEPQGQEELRDEASKFLGNLDSVLRTMGSVECVKQSDLHFCVQETGLKEQAGGRRPAKTLATQNYLLSGSRLWPVLFYIL